MRVRPANERKKPTRSPYPRNPVGIQMHIAVISVLQHPYSVSQDRGDDLIDLLVGENRLALPAPDLIRLHVADDQEAAFRVGAELRGDPAADRRLYRSGDQHRGLPGQ